MQESSLNSSITSVAYLCNTANWNATYVESTDITAGAYAIGGVSAEMFCDSYTQATGTTFSARAYSENSTYGYRFKPGHSDASVNSERYGYYSDNTNYPLTTEKGGMYNLGSGKFPWLASPASYATNHVCLVSGIVNYLCSTEVKRYAFGVRPAVSLPSTMKIQLTN